MGRYENGQTTRELILDTCFRLFLKKGFHETSYDDICREAHVNRGSIYYHFKEKENIRYEVLWKLMQQNREYAEKLCPESKHSFLLALYILWRQIFDNAAVYKFFQEYHEDQPVYTPSAELGHFYRIIASQMLQDIWELEKVDDLSFASFYGHMHGLMDLAGEHLEHYDAEIVLRHCIFSAFAVYRIPVEKAEALWAELKNDIDVLNSSMLK